MSRIHPKVQITREMLEQMYVSERLPAETIANQVGCGSTTVLRRLRECGFPIRCKSDYRFQVSSAQLRELYIEKGYTEDQIGEGLGCSGRTIGRRLEQWGIERRSVGPVARHTVPPHILSRWSPGLAYVVGLVATDGSLTKGNYEVEFVSAEMELIRLYSGLLGLDGAPVGESHYDKRTWYRLRTSDRKYRVFLERVGLTTAKSRTIGPLDIPELFFVDFVRGVLDGDGSWYTTKSFAGRYEYLKVELCSASQRFLTWIHEEIAKLANLRGNLRSRFSGRSFDLSFAGTKAVALGEWLYYSGDVPALGRKRQVWERMKNIADSRSTRGQPEL